MCIVGVSQGQFHDYFTNDFEAGLNMDNTFALGYRFEDMVSLVDLNAMTGMSPQFRDICAMNETGQYAIKLHSDPTNWITGLGSGVVLIRDKLGMDGQALMQADFYIPPPDQVMPNIALLAMEPLKGNEVTPQSLYRFGVAENKWLYFSHVDVDSPSANIFVFDSSIAAYLPRPAWHRFAMLFEGGSRIRCFIDGRELAFSPIEDSSLGKLQAGIMLADKKLKYDCYVDNLCIKWAQANTPLPECAYAQMWRQVPGQNQQVAMPATAMPSQFQNGIEHGGTQTELQWLDYTTARAYPVWSQSPKLFYFSTPKGLATQHIENLFKTDADARQCISKYIRVKVNITDTQGSQIARHFSVYKAPTIVVLNHADRETGRVIVSEFDSWNVIHDQIE
jgi:hypothetical protein